MALLRINRFVQEHGYSRTKFYADVAAGLMVQPVKLGARASGIPAEEGAAILSARIGGATDAQIRQLVQRLHARRQTVAASVLAGV